MEIKAFVSDVDKTLTNDKLVLDLGAIRTIRQLEAAGIPVVLVTARDYMTAATLSQFMGACGLVAAENGSVLLNFRSKMPPVPVVLGDPQRVAQGVRALQDSLGDLISVFPTPGRLCSAVVGRKFPVEVGNQVLKDHDTHTRLLDSSLAYHLVDEDTGKGRGVREAAAALGIEPANVVAIGDNFNDMEMFRAAAYSIAVGNAPQEVKNQVDYACKAKYGVGFREGVLHALYQFGREDVAFQIKPLRKKSKVIGA